MNALWNKKDLERPANNIWIASRQSIDITRFVSALEVIIKELDSQSALHMEAAILSRLIYRMKSKFRSDKGLKNMEKVNRALLNYLDIKLQKEYQDLKNCVELDGRVVNLPTKQMIQYVLVRTQGFAKLMCRIENVAKFAAEFFKTRINIGHAWIVSVIAYAVISRVWYLSRYLLKRCCAWYNSVIEYVDRFKQIGPNWLPSNYHLPSNLKTWLKLPWIDQATDSVPLKDDGKETIFSLIKTQIDDPYDLNIQDKDVDSSIKINDDSICVLQNTSMINQEILKEESFITAKHEVSFFTDDIGTSIDRESFRLNSGAGSSDSKKQIENKKSLKRKKEEASISEIVSKNNTRVLPKAKLKKSKALVVAEDISSPVLAKRRKKIIETEVEGSSKSSETSSTTSSKIKNPKNQTEECKNGKKATLRMKKLKFEKMKKKSSKINTESSIPDKKPKNSASQRIKTREDLTKFLSKNSYPGLDRLQWNMLVNSIKKFTAGLEKCGPSDEKRKKVLLKKVNNQIQNWIR